MEQVKMKKLVFICCIFFANKIKVSTCSDILHVPFYIIFTYISLIYKHIWRLLKSTIAKLHKLVRY